MATSKTRVVVALSGGVDSSVTAALLLEEGYEVIGVTLQLRSCQDATRSRSCCGLDGVTSARAAAGHLGIPHYVLDWQRVFEELVLRPTWEEYACGRTPNPCVECNQRVKFGLLREHAMDLGAGRIATGHYARIHSNGGSAGPVLLRGRDAAKDQSYFLFSLTGEQLGSTLLPLGELCKDETRAVAKRLGLPNAEQPESQDACLGSNEAAFAESLRLKFNQPARPGAIVDDGGDVLGQHQGIHRFTIGQRRGLGVAMGRRAWVKAIDPQDASVVLSTDEHELLADGLVASRICWSSGLQSGRCQVQIRYNHKPVEARVDRGKDRTVQVRFHRPQRAVTPGQAVVFYDGDRVIGGGWIDRALAE